VIAVHGRAWYYYLPAAVMFTGQIAVTHLTAPLGCIYPCTGDTRVRRLRIDDLWSDLL